jgi:hypothetical protein
LAGPTQQRLNPAQSLLAVQRTRLEESVAGSDRIRIELVQAVSVRRLKLLVGPQVQQVRHVVGAAEHGPTVCQHGL